MNLWRRTYCICFLFDPDTGEPYDVFLVGRGYKASDVPLNQALYEAGVNISKIMQGEDE